MEEVRSTAAIAELNPYADKQASLLETWQKTDKK